MNNTAKLLEFSDLIEIENIRQALEKIYINDDSCYVRMLDKSNNKFRTFSTKTILNSDNILNFKKGENVDIMLSLNPFKNLKGATKNNLFCINAIAIDLDYKKIKEFEQLSKDQIIKLLELDYFNKKVPFPSIIEMGNQIRLIYLIETCYIPKRNKSVVALAERVIKVFTKELKEFGAEIQGLQSYFRAIGSINSKNNSVVKMYQYPDAVRYTLKELQDLWLDEIPNWYKSWKAKKKGKRQVKNNIMQLHNLYTLNKNRLSDCEKYQDYLNSNKINNFRGRLCFLYRNYVLINLKYTNKNLTEKDYEYAKNEMLKYNAKFNMPLRENVIESATRIVNSTQYYYKNESLISFLEITENLCETMNLNSIYKIKTTEQINKDYYFKNKKKILKEKKLAVRDENGLTQREKKKQKTIKDIKKLKKQGLNNREIAEELKMNIRSIRRILNTEEKEKGRT